LYIRKQLSAFVFTLYKKEIRAFLSSLIGYIAICVFLLLVGLFLWILPTDSNLLNNGYAGLDSLFELAPWVFLFLIPSITMRSFADEKKAGTIEFLLTKPLTDMQIILAKYLAGVTLVLFSLLPTLIYYYSIYKLGNPIGNIDSGGTWGSYIGSIFSCICIYLYRHICIFFIRQPNYSIHSIGIPVLLQLHRF
jgi:ABC-2 type transport system permease protein